MIDLETQKETLNKAFKTVTDTTVTAGTKAIEVGTTTVKTVNDNKLVVRFKDLGSTRPRPCSKRPSPSQEEAWRR